MKWQLVAFALVLGASPARTADDMPTMTVGYYLHAFATKTPAEQLAVVHYLSGIRDHIYWQCKYTVTVRDLMDAANSMIAVWKAEKSHPQFVEWAKKTPFGDMVFIGIKANPPHGQLNCS
ncbi:hypothetical protein ACC827_26525 [Rhizobium ruizarguesonis]